ncbi:epsin-1-like [Octopus sinensis]|uniref:Epsin-1-like n=1 Tax=Octopus sinensis TaxID=2607531 RepID=A0A6P7TQP7_9MOLL|nr:epsin-1-like [Octopus sinensis]
MLTGNQRENLVRTKMREATSKDSWGPSSTLMAEIADFTHEPNLLQIIMTKIWKIINDENKNWQRVNKTLNLLTYITLTGSQYVASRCLENLSQLEDLVTSENVEKAGEKGFNVESKTYYLFSLLKNSERLQEARFRAINTRNSVSGLTTCSPVSETDPSTDRTGGISIPKSRQEEQEQLELALSLSMIEAKKNEEATKEDEKMLQEAIKISRSEYEVTNTLVDLSDAIVVAPSQMLQIELPPSQTQRMSSCELVDPWSTEMFTCDKKEEEFVPSLPPYESLPSDPSFLII